MSELITELKPCSACGGTDLLFDTEVIEFSVIYFIECLHCNMLVRNADPLKLVSTWNTRPLEDALRAALAAANKDAERLANAAEGGFFHSNHFCGYCGSGYEWGDDVQEIQHSADCPIILHRARVNDVRAKP
jgi:hypothetical protein